MAEGPNLIGYPARDFVEPTSLSRTLTSNLVIAGEPVFGTDMRINRFVPLLITDRMMVQPSFGANLLCPCGVRVIFPEGQIPTVTTACPGCGGELVTYEED